MKRKVLLFFSLICVLAAILLVIGIEGIRQDSGQYTEVNNTIDGTDSEIIPYSDKAEENSASNNGKTIYLTFDDGPYMYTEKLLSILDRYNVKATFFTTCQNEDYVNLISAEAEAGHAVGIHTYCHKYKTIYKSDDEFIKDFEHMQSLIHNQTGAYSRLYRFPGGSSNTVSKMYCSGIVARMVDFLNNAGYVYFDWDVTSGDSEGLDNAEAITQSVIQQILEMDQTDYIVLQHDIYECSVDATEEIIKWGLENGYRFDKLDVNSPTVHFEVAN